MSANPPLRIVNARAWDGETAVARDLYIAGGRIVERAAPGAQTVDLAGHTIFPGLTNAHDHLELNHYPRTKFREVYASAHQWGEDVSARLDSEPFKALRAFPLQDRLFIGGLKNLLCGVTAVIHHGPPHRPMFRRDFPVRVLKQYGWAHSLHFSTDAEIIESYRRTSRDRPWFIHLAEGTDDSAAGEYQRLKALGCVGPNTVLVHGVGLTAADVADAALRIRGLVCCPTTNRYLLNASPPIERWRAAGGRLWLGSDSRLTGDGDLLAEYQQGAFVTSASSAANLSPALVDVGHLMPGARADWFAAPAFPVTRREIALVVRDGMPYIGDAAIMAQFAQTRTVAAVLDGAERRIHIDLARQILRCRLREPGLEVDTLPASKRFFRC